MKSNKKPVLLHVVRKLSLPNQSSEQDSNSTVCTTVIVLFIFEINLYLFFWFCLFLIKGDYSSTGWTYITQPQEDGTLQHCHFIPESNKLKTASGISVKLMHITVRQQEHVVPTAPGTIWKSRDGTILRSKQYPRVQENIKNPLWP